MRPRFKLIFLFIVLSCSLSSLTSCLSENALKIKADFPRYTNLKLDDFPVVVLTNFLVEQSPPGFDLNQELITYFLAELKQKYRGQLTQKNIVWPEEKKWDAPQFWHNLLGNDSQGLVLTGTASFKQELRKTLGSKDYREIDGPFRLGQPSLEERTVSTLTVRFFLVRPEDGQVLLKKEYKEIRTAENFREPAGIAFFELVQLVKTKFFNLLFARELPEERYLLVRDSEQ